MDQDKDIRKCDNMKKQIQIRQTSRNKLENKAYRVITDNDSNTRYQCLTCEKKCNTRKLIFAHHYNVHKEMKFKCKKCDKLFPFKSYLYFRFHFSIEYKTWIKTKTLKSVIN